MFAKKSCLAVGLVSIFCIGDAVAKGSWRPIAPMSIARFGLAATTANCPSPNGDHMCIYALGGDTRIDVPNIVDTVEAYDPDSETWSTVAHMPTARRFLAGGTGKDGTIYAIGGVCCGVDFPGTDPHFFDTVEAYNPDDDTWKTDLPPMSTARGSLRAAVGEDGRIFAIGGYDGKTILNTAEAYSPAAGGQSSFAVTDLGTLGGETSVACGLNDLGQVVGFSFLANGESHAFVWSDVGMRDLGTLPDLGFSEARNINRGGQIVGDSTAQFATPPFHAVFWQKIGVPPAPLGTLGGAASFAVDINSQGQLVGGARDGRGQLHAFLWQDGEMRDLGTLPGHVLSVARGINRHGQAVGNSEPIETASIGHCPTTPMPVEEHHPVLWDNGSTSDLGTLGGVFGMAKGINDGGQVVGSSSLANGEEHAFLWSEGVMSDLGTLGGGYSLANRINHRGRIVGLSRTSDGELHAVLWHRGRMTDLNSLIPTDSGWVLVEATDINRRGEIVGVGTISGETHAFLLTPVEEDE